MSKSLSPVINVDNEKCISCHACITECPVKYCIDGSGDHVKIIHDLCIGCGNCIEVCTHDARTRIDDTDSFYDALKSNQNIIAIAAPAVASSFPDTYLNLNGYLKSIGVNDFFDVSFGAELTIKSYLHHLENNNPDMIIAQPCPAIVSFIELYRPELIKYLAPADSPMAHTIKMIKNFYEEYGSYKILVISPCVAKKREFEEIGLGDYNVTIHSLLEKLNNENINLKTFEPTEYRNPSAERAVLFSSPGGLLRTALRENPEVINLTRKIEGVHSVYKYLAKLPEMIEKGFNPLLVDCLNCEMGCNGGTGTGNSDKSLDEIEYFVEKRKKEHEIKYGNNKKKVNKIVSKYWKKNLYTRSYKDLSSTRSLNIPSEQEIQNIFKKMLKENKEDILNCTSCGYGNCEKMAIAIFNGLNKSDNCYHYKQKIILRSHSTVAKWSVRLHEEIQKSKDLIEKSENIISTCSDHSNSQFDSLEESYNLIDNMVQSLYEIKNTTNGRKQVIDSLIDVAQTGEKDMDDTVKSIKQVSESVKVINELINVINSVASSTNLLSMNAAIEAAHAGSAGAGFSIVAQEIRNLAEASGKNSRSISKALNEIMDSINHTSEISVKTSDNINRIITDTKNMASSMSDLVQVIEFLSSSSSQVTGSLSKVKEISSGVRKAYTDLEDIITEILKAVDSISKISQENLDSVQAIESFN